MQNVNIKTEKKKLTIEVDLSKELGKSKSGKSVNIGTTGGNQKIQTDIGEVVVGVNVYKAAK